ncbi:Protein VP3 [Rhizoctonia solani]|uniref:Protein VP3 n=1 Tax=Rhizoctonia solani TaxID=456999 RepID=A0A0K6GH85_9AGAM|nr:Protein VP3 [Rhizoctonia solani]
MPYWDGGAAVCGVDVRKELYSKFVALKQHPVSRIRTYECDFVLLVGPQSWWKDYLIMAWIAPQFPSPGNPSSKNVSYKLRAHVQEFERARSEFIQSGDQEGLVAWAQKRDAIWDVQSKEGDVLLKYINWVAASRSTELQDLKAERQEQIHKRLKALGWNEKYFDFSKGSNSARKQWHNLVEVPKLFTERIWTNMLPKLRQLLEENRPQLDEYERQQRQDERCHKVETMLRNYKKATDPYRFIVHALQSSSVMGNVISIKQSLDFWAPFPGNLTLNSWDFIFNMYKEENTLKKVQELFEKQRNILEQKLSEWRIRVEDQLVEQYTLSLAHDDNVRLNTALTIKGSTDHTKDLSDHARFLLRADTVFMASDLVTSDTEFDREHGPVARSIYYLDISMLYNSPYLYETKYSYDPNEEVEKLNVYVRHAVKEAISRALLEQLDMHNVAYIELKQMGDVFVCGRCSHSKAMGWRDIVDHYHMKRRDWLGDRFVHNNFTTRHPVIFRNIHDLAPDTSSRPLVRISISTNAHPGSVAYCLICREIERYERFESLEEMKEHLVEVHDAKEPVENLHFIAELDPFGVMRGSGSLGGRTDWERKWDEYHSV